MSKAEGTEKEEIIDRKQETHKKPALPVKLDNSAATTTTREGF
jgi:hypothetical protein